jgi:SAM-dependent methyltransferase
VEIPGESGLIGDDRGYQADELAAVYDAVHADRDDAGFWQAMAAEAGDGPILELACGTGRVLLPLARAGHEITGIDRSERMLDLCRAKLSAETPEVRRRVRVLAADMTSFALGGRFAMVTVPFGSFQHLLTVEDQLACLARCRTHLLPGGRLVLDLPNPSPAPPSSLDEKPDAGAEDPEFVDWADGRRIRWWATVSGAHPSLQMYAFEVSYEVVEADGATRQITDRLLLRYVFRYELEHLLLRAGFGIVALYGDYDRSSYADESPAMIFVAEPAADCDEG